MMMIKYCKNNKMKRKKRGDSIGDSCFREWPRKALKRLAQVDLGDEDEVDFRMGSLKIMVLN
jgi:hypothetical protein